jgi:hypothetical protein
LNRLIGLIGRSARRLQEAEKKPDDQVRGLFFRNESRLLLLLAWEFWTEVMSKEKQEAAGSDRKYVLAALGDGPRYNLTDTDMLLIQKALSHGLNDGHITENKERAQGMVAEIERLRTDQG